MLHEKYRELRDLVNACTTAEEVAEIGWNIIEVDYREQFLPKQEDEDKDGD